MKIKRTKQPDRLKYEGRNFKIRSYDDGSFVLYPQNNNGNGYPMRIEFAKELAKVLPKFLEEMEKND